MTSSPGDVTAVSDGAWLGGVGRGGEGVTGRGPTTRVTNSKKGLGGCEGENALITWAVADAHI